MSPGSAGMGFDGDELGSSSEEEEEIVRDYF